MKLDTKQMLNRAATIAVRAHEGHVRKDGSPYIAHPLRVALNANSSHVVQTVALLHDVIEDTPITLEHLREEGFTEEVLLVLDAVTKRKGEKYTDFISRIIDAGESAVRVKLADIQDNMEDQSALDPEEAEFLYRRYSIARERLLETLG